jgi:hypothetical protein
MCADVRVDMDAWGRRIKGHYATFWLISRETLTFGEQRKFDMNDDHACSSPLYHSTVPLVGSQCHYDQTTDLQHPANTLTALSFPTFLDSSLPPSPPSPQREPTVPLTSPEG